MKNSVINTEMHENVMHEIHFKINHFLKAIVYRVVLITIIYKYFRNLKFPYQKNIKYLAKLKKQQKIYV